MGEATKIPPSCDGYEPQQAWHDNSWGLVVALGSKQELCDWTEDLFLRRNTMPGTGNQG